MRSWVWTCLALSVSSCAGPLENPERFAYLDGGGVDGGSGGLPDGGCDAPAAVFIPSCATGACHNAQSQQGNLDLESPGLAARLVGKKAQGGPGLLIDKASVGNSVLLTKLGASPPFGFQMPLGAQPLSAGDLACVQTWVFGAAH